MAAEPPPDESRPGFFRRAGRAIRNAFRRATGRAPVPPPEAPPAPPEAPPEAPPAPPEAPPEPPPAPPEAPPEPPPEPPPAEPPPEPPPAEPPPPEEPERRVYGNPDQTRPDNWRGVYPTLQPILGDFQGNVPPGIWALVYDPDEDGWVLYVGDSP